MKNPFVMMALMASAMAAAFRENAYRDAGMSLPGGRGKSRIPGKKNAAGSKLIKRFYRAHHGKKADDFEEARTWYAQYLSDADARVREQEAKRRAAREAPLKLAA